MSIELKLPKTAQQTLTNGRIDELPLILLDGVAFQVGGDAPLAETLAQPTDFVDVGVFPGHRCQGC